MVTSGSKTTVLALLDEGLSGDAMVKLRSGDTFLVAVADAARACRAFEQAAQFGSQFNDLLDHLGVWIGAHKSQIHRAHLLVRQSDILFLVTQRAAEFDRALVDELTQLDLEIANSEVFDLIDMEVLAIPPVSDVARTAFLSSGEVLSYAD